MLSELRNSLLDADQSQSAITPSNESKKVLSNREMSQKFMDSWRKTGSQVTNESLNYRLNVKKY